MPSGASPESRCGISRKSACSRRTRPANSPRLARACSRVSPSLSRPNRRPSGALARRMAAAWPPRPTVPSTHSPPGLTASSSSVSARRTLVWPASDPILREEPPVLVRERLLLEQPLLQPLQVPDREVVLQPEHAHLALHRGAL